MISLQAEELTDAAFIQLGADDAQAAHNIGSTVADIQLAGDEVEVDPLTVGTSHDALGTQNDAVLAGIQLLQNGADLLSGVLLGSLTAPGGEDLVGVVVMMVMVMATAGAVLTMLVMVVMLVVVIVTAAALLAMLVVVMMLVVMVVAAAALLAMLVVMVMMLMVVIVTAAALLAMLVMVVMLMVMVVAAAAMLLMLMVMLLLGGLHVLFQGVLALEGGDELLAA